MNHRESLLSPLLHRFPTPWYLQQLPIDPPECIKEFEGRIGEVHDEVIDEVSFRTFDDGNGSGKGTVCVGLTGYASCLGASFRWDGDGVGGEGGVEEVEDGLTHKVPSVFVGASNRLFHLVIKSISIGWNEGGMGRTLLILAFSAKDDALAGLRSLARTPHPFLPAGIAKGPTPANASQTTSVGLNAVTRRSCSVESREFQYTFEKSNLNVQFDSDCHHRQRGYGEGEDETHCDDVVVVVACEDFHGKVAIHVVDGVELVDNCSQSCIFLEVDLSVSVN